MKVSGKHLAVPIGWLLAVLFLWLAIRKVNFQEVGAALGEARLYLALPMVICFLLFYWLKAMRWGILIDPTSGVPVRKLMPSMMVGFAGNNVLPVRLGEVLRIYLAGLDLPQGRSFILATMIVERIFDVLAIVMLLAAGSFFIDVAAIPVPNVRLVLLATTAIVITIALMCAYPPRWVLAPGTRALHLFPERIERAISARLTDAHQGFSALRQANRMLVILLNSLLQWSLMALCIFLAITALDIGVSPVAALVVMGLLVAGVSLPGAPGFVGTIEYCFVAGLGLFEIAPSPALGAAIFYHVLNFVFVTALGGYYLRHYNASWKSIRADSSAVKND